MKTKSLPTMGFFIGVLFFVSLACGGSGDAPVVSMNSDGAYWTCVTATPVPTRKITIGTATAPAIPDPFRTPGVITKYTTPVPTETPQYQVEEYYMNQLVHTSGLGIELKHVSRTPSEIPTLAIYNFTFEVTNMSGRREIIPLAMLVGIRNVTMASGVTLTGRWLPDVTNLTEAEYTYADGEMKEVHLSIEVPDGRVDELLVVGQWDSSLEGGVPMYFLIDSYPHFCGFGSAKWLDGNPPPPPTPIIIGLGRSGGTGTGVCGPPATGSFIRGFGCNRWDTGIVGNGCAGTTPFFHNGWDIANDVGTTIVAPADGEIVFAGDAGWGLGNEIRIDAGTETHALGHMSAFLVTGGSVVAGQPIGEMGNSGRSTGPHVHWTIRRGGIAIDPATWTGCTEQ